MTTSQPVFSVNDYITAGGSLGDKHQDDIYNVLFI